jgi:uncharacterized membrane protein
LAWQKLLSQVSHSKFEEKALTLESSKKLGGIGAILLLAGTVALFADPFLAVIAFVGLILVLVAMRDFAAIYKENHIFTGTLAAFISVIVGVTVSGITIVYMMFDTSIITNAVHGIYPTWNKDWASLPSAAPEAANLTFGNIAPLIWLFVPLCIFAIIVSMFAMQPLRALGKKTNVNLFSFSSIMLVTGAVLTIFFGLGFVLMWIATLLLAIAFFQIKPQPEQPPAPVTAQSNPQPPTPPA